MAFIPPPRPLTLTEFKERWDAGARTMAEIDPALNKWLGMNMKIPFLKKRKAKKVGKG